MYHKTLHIALFGTAEEVACAIRSRIAYQYFEHDIVSFPSFDQKSFDGCDIAFIDAGAWERTKGSPLVPSRDLAAANDGLKQIHKNRFCAVVVIATKEQSASWKEEDFAAVTDVWTAPLSEREAGFRFEGIQQRAKMHADLFLSENCFNTLIDSIPSMVWVKSVDGIHLNVNDFFCSVVGKQKDDVIGKGHNYIWGLPLEDTESAEVCAQSEQEAILAGKTCEFREQVDTSRGKRMLITYKTPFYGEDGSVVGTISIADDITEIDNIRLENDLLLDSLPLAVIVEDRDETITNINATTEEYFQQKKEDTIGMNFSEWRKIAFGEDLARIREQHESAELLVDRGGVQRLMYMRKAPILDVFGNPTGQVRIYNDMTVQRELEQRALLNARTDYLTGLFNRRYFYEHLDDYDESRSVAIALFDLDDFKRVNDTMGHAIGDHVLILVGSILREVFPDSMVIRWGGDEFVVAMFDIPNVEVMSERVERALELFVLRSSAPGEPWKIYGSAGIAFSLTVPNPIDPLVQRADGALYAAKEASKGTVYIAQ